MYRNSGSKFRSGPKPPRFRGGNGGNGGGNARRNMSSFNPYVFMQETHELVQTVPVEILHTFADFGLTDILQKNIAGKGYKEPTPIQDQAISHIMEGRDIIGIANTGTGKTAAFLIPLIQKALTDKTSKVLIVAPTRELAFQIRDECFSFTRGLPIYSVLCIGGTDMHRQRNDLRRQFQFVIGTPGRLKDLIDSRALNISDFRTVVLDEADHMVDIGFLHTVKYIISLLPKVRQSLFFSATIDGKVQEVLRGFVSNPITVSVKMREATENVEQTVVRVIDPYKKMDQLHDLLIKEEYEKVLIFGRTKHGIQKLSNELVKRGFKADAIHGNKRQSQRLRVLNAFKRNEIQILLATDVASRGLDIPNVSHVINYDLPESKDAYIHRIGRTGRADKKGIALTFI